MNTQRVIRWGSLALGAAVLLTVRATPAAVEMNGGVSLEYYVAEVDAEGFESTAADFAVEQIDNTSASASGPLSLAGWATTAASPAGAGDEIGYLPLDPLSGYESYFDVSGTAPADDLPPGEYYTHVLLQDERYPGTWDDARSLTPKMLWRGGLEAVGPLDLTSDAYGDYVWIDFAELRNNRLDSRVTNDIALTLYATVPFGPAADGYTLCRVTVPGLYAGDLRDAPGFDCAINDIPDGDYTVHLAVAEIGGRGGSSTLSGPDIRVRGGRIDPGYCCGYVDGTIYVAGLDLWMLLPLLLVALMATNQRLTKMYLTPFYARRSRACRTMVRIRAS